MSIDKQIAELIAALNENTSALKAAAGAAGSTSAATSAETKSTGKGSAKKEKEEVAKITQDQVNAALLKIKDEFGLDEAKKVIKEFGKVDKMSEIKPATFQAVYDGAVAKYAELSNAGSGEGEDDGL